MMPPADGENRDGDLRSRLVSAEKEIASTIHKVDALEKWRTLTDIAEARKEGQWVNLKEKLDSVSTDVGEIKGTLTWINRIIIGGIVLAIIAFIVKGGLNVPL